MSEVEQLKEILGQIRDKADNYLQGAKLPGIPTSTHVAGLRCGMREIKKLAVDAVGKE